MSHVVIDLENYKSVGNDKRKLTSIVGRDNGIKAREENHIDDKLELYDLIKIKIPDDVNAISPSFLETFLETIVKKLGREEFLKRIIIESEKYDHTEVLRQAISRILRLDSI